MIPDAVDATTYPQQARLASRDIDIIAAGSTLTGVESGGAVTAQGSPNMTVAVAAGVFRINGRRVVYAGGNSGTFAAASGSNPRIDLLTCDTSGALQIVTGTAAATPQMPTIPASRVVLARIDIFTSATTITTGQIVDKRVLTLKPSFEAAEWYGAVGDNSTINNTPFANWKTAVVAAGVPGVIGNGIFRIQTSAIDWTGDGLTIHGAGMKTCRIRQITDGVDTVHIGGENQIVDGLWFEHLNLQDATTGGVDVAFTAQAFLSSYRNIRTYRGKCGLDGTSGQFIFSCEFATWDMFVHQRNFIKINTDGNTGSTFTNIYCNNKDGSTIYSCTEAAINLYGFHDGRITQLNVEDLISSSDKVILFDQSRAMSASSLHFERVQTTNFLGDLVRIGTNTFVSIDGMSVFNCEHVGTANPNRAIFGVDGGSLVVRGLNMENNLRQVGVTLWMANIRQITGSTFSVSGFRQVPTLITTSAMGTATPTGGWATGNELGSSLIMGTNAGEVRTNGDRALTFDGLVSVAAGANAGTSPPGPVPGTSTDSVGLITFGSGTGSPAIGAYVVVTFRTAYAKTPNVVLAAANSATAAKQPYLHAVSTTSFTIGLGVAAPTGQANTVYSVSYQVNG